MTPITAYIAEVRERLANATPGPWIVNDDYFPIEVWTNPQDTKIACLDQRTDFSPGKTKCFNNAVLIAHAPTDLDKLTTALELAVGALVDACYRHHMDCDKNCVDICPIKIRDKALTQIEQVLRG
jgi:hypothetical protein